MAARVAIAAMIATLRSTSDAVSYLPSQAVLCHQDVATVLASYRARWP